MGFWLIFGLSTFSIVCDVQMYLNNSTLILLLFQLIYKPPWSFWVSTAHYWPTHSTCNDINIDACIYFAFFSQNLGIKLYFANISRLTVFGTIIFVQVWCNDYFRFFRKFPDFSRFLLFLSHLKNHFVNILCLSLFGIVIVADSEWHNPSASFVSQSHVTCH